MGVLGVMLVSFLCAMGAVNSFCSTRFGLQLARSDSFVAFAKGKKAPKAKGFGTQAPEVLDEETFTTSVQQSTDNDLSSPLDNSSTTIEESGRKSLDDEILNTKMFKQTRKQREILLQDKIQKVRDEEELIASDPSVGAVPELVADRMLGRIITFFGIPVFGGMAIFAAAVFASKKYDLTVPPTIIAYATQLPFVVGLMGISYAILSSSWDEEPGSALGIKEFKINVQRIRDGFARTREQEVLRGEIETETEKLRRSRK